MRNTASPGLGNRLCFHVIFTDKPDIALIRLDAAPASDVYKYVYTARSTVYTCILVYLYMCICIHSRDWYYPDSIKTALNLISASMYLMTPYLQDMTRYQPR